MIESKIYDRKQKVSDYKLTTVAARNTHDLTLGHRLPCQLYTDRSRVMVVFLDVIGQSTGRLRVYLKIENDWSQIYCRRKFCCDCMFYQN